ncbi:MAG: FtsQ-type POTRA domain-containing protein [Prevotella sp.]|nr:FtsQ-type POTRA domain-containing protein [Prevotella sp.]
MNFNWKKTAIILTDILLAVYLVLAVTAFNHPDELSSVCGEVNIQIEDGTVKGFLTADEIKAQLKHQHIYPLGDPIAQVPCRQIEEVLQKNPFVKSVECYKTHTGHVNIKIVQRMPVMRIKADNGDDYYVDEHGNIMPATRLVSNLAVATGHINKTYAQKILTNIGVYLLKHPMWLCQVEQLNVLADGSMEMVPRVGNHIVYLGLPVKLDKKFARLEKFYRYGLSKAGWNKYAYINVEFDNQIICRRTKL